MPIHRGYDRKGCYYQYGDRKKYYYVCGNAKSRLEAKKLAIKQMVAIAYSKVRSGKYSTRTGSRKGSRKVSMKGSSRKMSRK